MFVEFSGAVLAGGRSSRFGSNKARHIYRGKPLIKHVINSFKPAAETFIVAGEAYSEFDVSVYEDILEAAGPLSGVHAALHYAQHDWVAVAACDMPFLTPDYWQTLAAHISTADALVVESERGLEPLAAFYKRGLEPLIAAYLSTNERSVHGFLKTVDTATVPLDTLKLPRSVLKNVNYPADLAHR